MNKIYTFLLLLFPILSVSDYSLIDNKPNCYFNLGPMYCPSPNQNQKWSDIYMSYNERIHMTLVNAMRTDPNNFAKEYNVTFKCVSKVNKPFLYDTNIHQAALQQTRILLDNCTFQHDTCSKYCSLYKSCAWYDRISKYDSSWSSLGENIAITSSSDPLGVLKQWANSPGHCTNMFADFKFIGIGNKDRYWTQDFITKGINQSYPLTAGAHWLNPKGNFIFLVSFYHETKNPSKIELRYNGVTYPMSIYLQNNSTRHSIYSITLPKIAQNTGCLSYRFNATIINDTWYTLPQNGFYQTSGFGNCSNNWIL